MRGVRSDHKRHLHLARSRCGGNTLLWLLVVVAAAGLLWLWWSAAKTKPRKSVVVSTPHVVSSNASSNAPVRVKTNAPLVSFAAGFPRPVQTVFEAQLALDRQGISSGSIDGKIGSQTHAAIRAFQRQSDLPATGGLDEATKTNLTLDSPPFANYTITSNDLARLQPISKTWLGKSQQTALDYETILERWWRRKTMRIPILSGV